MLNYYLYYKKIYKIKFTKYTTPYYLKHSSSIYIFLKMYEVVIYEI